MIDGELPKIIFNRIFIILFCLFTFFFGRSSADAGEIININEKYQLVFTDLTSTTLKPGDIVQIKLKDSEIIYLEAVDVSSILSKLGPVNSGAMKTDMESFKKIAIGNPVEKINDSASATPKESSPPQAVPEEDNKAALSVQRLEKELSLAREEIKDLQEKNAGLEKKIVQLSADQETFTFEKEKYEAKIKESQNLISSLKEKLEKMKKIVATSGK